METLNRRPPVHKTHVCSVAGETIPLHKKETHLSGLVNMLSSQFESGQKQARAKVEDADLLRKIVYGPVTSGTYMEPTPRQIVSDALPKRISYSIEDGNVLVAYK
ncbi:hypothetical protein GOV05_03040 [Candidatus Woesearchaeota archaeon]|nr:hypothetical protein [Candidatus Woesearchaeota archaeon]